jgi:hypothetical protein
MATSGRGWVGTMREVSHFLRVIGADQDEEGRFIIGREVVTFLGMQDENAEAVVGCEAVYFVGGQPAPLAAGLRSTSCGSGVWVIV